MKVKITRVGGYDPASGKDNHDPTLELTEAQRELMSALRSAHSAGVEWVRPIDLGGKDGSNHSQVLAQLVKRGLVERTKRNTLANMIGYGRGSYVYRVVKLKALKGSE